MFLVGTMKQIMTYNKTFNIEINNLQPGKKLNPSPRDIFVERASGDSLMELDNFFKQLKAEKKKKLQNIFVQTVYPSEKMSQAKEHKLTPYNLAELLYGELKFALRHNRIFVYDKFFGIVRPLFEGLGLGSFDNLARTIVPDRYINSVTTRLTKEALQWLKTMDMPIIPDLQNPDLVVLEDGTTCNIRTNEIFDPSFDFLMTTRLKVGLDEFDSDLFHAGKFYAFMSQFSSEDKEIMEANRYRYALALSNIRSTKDIFYVFGDTNTGKGVDMDILTSFFEDEAISALKLKRLASRFGFASIYNTSLAFVSDEQNNLWDDDVQQTLKIISSRQLVECERKYEDTFKFVPFCLPILYSNRIPSISGSDDEGHAMSSRIFAIPTCKTVTTINPYLLKQILPEKAQIAQWALRFAGKIAREEKTIDHVIDVSCTAEEILRPEDLFRKWLNECVVYKDDAMTRSANFYESYAAYCQGFDTRLVLTQKAFYMQFAGMFESRKRRKDDSTRCYVGLALREGGIENA
jgi:phage/plasmid-associated DNA primase